ncbi:MAG: hypothetical protein ABIE03_02185 [Patescibacteria group bacterium]|nr:hypothetical protein [Patescibacteria group bacterium]
MSECAPTFQAGQEVPITEVTYGDGKVYAVPVALDSLAIPIVPCTIDSEPTKSDAGVTLSVTAQVPLTIRDHEKGLIMVEGYQMQITLPIGIFINEVVSFDRSAVCRMWLSDN